MSGPSAEDLRERIAEALTAWSCTVAGVPDTSKLMPQHREAVEQNSAARADAVMAVVQPELDAKDERIAELEAERDRLAAHLESYTADVQDLLRRKNEGLEALEIERDQLREAAAFLVATLNPRDIGRARKGMHRRMYVHVVPLLHLIDEIERQCPDAIKQQRAALDQAPAAEHDEGGQ